MVCADSNLVTCRFGDKYMRFQVSRLLILLSVVERLSMFKKKRHLRNLPDWHLPLIACGLLNRGLLSPVIICLRSKESRTIGKPGDEVQGLGWAGFVCVMVGEARSNEVKVARNANIQIKKIVDRVLKEPLHFINCREIVNVIQPMDTAQ